jgi:hypothetical protein
MTGTGSSRVSIKSATGPTPAAKVVRVGSLIARAFRPQPTLCGAGVGAIFFAAHAKAGRRGDPCVRPGLRATSANRTTTRVAPTAASWAKSQHRDETPIGASPARKGDQVPVLPGGCSLGSSGCTFAPRRQANTKKAIKRRRSVPHEIDALGRENRPQSAA